MNNNSSTVLQFLDKKQKSLSADNVSVSTSDLSQKTERNDRIRPNFNFVIESFIIGEHVEYNVVMIEKYKVLGRTLTNNYPFKTRYSMLEVLDRKLGGMDFPGKKFFGNKDPSFLKKRQVDLENYLNRISRSGKPEFYKFIKQIKDSEFNLSLKEKFFLE